MFCWLLLQRGTDFAYHITVFLLCLACSVSLLLTLRCEGEALIIWPLCRCSICIPINPGPPGDAGAETQHALCLNLWEPIPPLNNLMHMHSLLRQPTRRQKQRCHQLADCRALREYVLTGRSTLCLRVPVPPFHLDTHLPNWKPASKASVISDQEQLGGFMRPSQYLTLWKGSVCSFCFSHELGDAGLSHKGHIRK